MFRSPSGRIRIAAAITYRALYYSPAETEQRSLAIALRGVTVGDGLDAAQRQPKQMKALAAQLQADREERARMESGVQFADEGAELPPVGSSGGH